MTKVIALGAQPYIFPRIGLALVLLALALVIGSLPFLLSLLFVLGAIALVLSLVRPEFNFCLLAFAVPFSSLGEVEAGPFTVTATEIVVGIAAISWGLRFAARREPLVLPWVALPISLFLVVVLFSTTLAPSWPLSLKELLKWLELFLVFLVAANSFKDRRQMKLVLASLFLASLVEAFLGVYQFAAQRGPEGFVVGEGYLRAFGTFGQPNPFAGYLGLVLPLAFSLSLSALNGHRPQWAPGVAFVGVVLFAAVVMSMSRGAWLAFAISAMVMTAIWSRRAFAGLFIFAFLAAFLAFLGTVGLLPPVVTERLAVITDNFGIFDVAQVQLTPQNWAVVERMANWQAAWNMAQDAPWLGNGIGNFSEVYPDYAVMNWKNLTGHAHNYFLNILAETGIIGLGAYIVLAVSSVVYAVTAFRCIASENRPEDSSFPSDKAISLGILGILLALHTHNFFDNLYVHGMAAQVGLMLGLLAAIVHSRKQPPVEPQRI